MEKWVEIKGYEGFQISNKGRVKGFSGNLLKVYQSRTPFVFLMKNRVRKVHRICNLIAEHFLENPRNFEYVEVINPSLDITEDNVRWVKSPSKRKNNIIKQILPTSTSKVNWKPLFEGYEISDWGQIKQLAHYRGKRLFPEKILTLQHHQGSLSVEIRGKFYLIKKLVAEHFLKPSNNPQEIHISCIDGNPYNVHVSNLKWVSKSDIHTKTREEKPLVISEDLQGQVLELSKTFSKKELAEIYELPLENIEMLLAS